MAPIPTDPLDSELHDTELTDLFDADIDLVPGNPPVPITVWRTPAADATGTMSPRLAARLLAAYTHRGDPVHDATADTVFAQAIGVSHRHPAAAHRDEPPEPATLVLTTWPPADGPIDPVILLGALRRRLAPAGVIVALVLHPSGASRPIDAGPLVRAARQARLAYLQHIVAVHTPTTGDQIEPGPAERMPRPDGWRHLRVHTDLLVFTPAGGRRG
jgi:hypothetical protein